MTQSYSNYSRFVPQPPESRSRLAFTSEHLFRHPLAFGVVDASPIQRAILRVADGRPLGKLAELPEVIKAFGGEDAVASLPHVPPLELYVVAAVRTGKSLMAAAIATKIALTADMSLVDPSETAAVPIVSVKKKNARIVMQHVMRALNRKGGLLSKYLVRNPKPTGEEVTIRRDDGQLVEICIAAGSRAGQNLVSRWVLSAVFDEAARQLGQEDGVVNFEDQRESVVTRLGLIGGQLIAITSPWAARGPVYEVCRSYERASESLVLVRGTGPEICPRNWPAEKVEKMRADPRQEASYTTDCLGLFADVDGGWLLASDIDRALGERTDETVDREPEYMYCAAMDPALRGNSWTLTIIGFLPSEDGDDSKGTYKIVRTRQWTGSRRDPLGVSATLVDVRAELLDYGLTEAWTDVAGAEWCIQAAEALGLRVIEDDSKTAEKDARHVDFKGHMLSGRVEPTTDPQWRADMLAARVRRTAATQKLELPLTKDGRHADYVPATLLAWAKAMRGPSNLDRIANWNKSRLAAR